MQITIDRNVPTPPPVKSVTLTLSLREAQTILACVAVAGFPARERFAFSRGWDHDAGTYTLSYTKLHSALEAVK